MFATLTLAVMCAFGMSNAMSPSVDLEMDRTTVVDEATHDGAFGVKLGLNEWSLSVRGLDHNLDWDKPMFELGVVTNVLPMATSLRVGTDRDLDVFHVGMDRLVTLDGMLGLNVGLGVALDRHDLVSRPHVEARMGLRVDLL